MTRLALRSTTAALVTLALAFAGGHALAGDTKGALAFVPADYTTVVAVDLEHVRKSPTYKAVTEAFVRDKLADDLAEFKTETGVDVHTDVKAIVIAGPDAMVKDGETFLMIAHGSFDAERVIAFAREKGAEITEKKGEHGAWYEIDGEGALAFRDGFLVLGPTKEVSRALAAKEAGEGHSEALSALLRRVQGAKGGFAVTTSGPAIDELKRDVKQFGAFTGAAVGIDLTKGMALEISADFKDDKAATELATMAQEGLREVANEPDLAEFSDTLSAVEVAAKGKTLTIRGAVSQAQMEMLLGMLR